MLNIHVKTHNTLYDFRELFLNSPKTTSTWHGFVGVYLYPQYKKNPENIKYKKYSTQNDKHLVKQWVGCIQLRGMHYLTLFTPTQNIGSALANFFSSLALFLQRNRQSKKYWGKNKIEGCGSYTTGANSSGVSHIQKLNVSLSKACTNIWVKVTIIKRKNNYWKSSVLVITGARGTDHPPFSNFLFTNLFSIKCVYFFIISSLFPYFNLFVSIFIQSHVNIKLHVSTLYIDTNNPQGMQLNDRVRNAPNI